MEGIGRVGLDRAGEEPLLGSTAGRNALGRQMISRFHERRGFEREAQLQGRPGLKGKAVIRFTVERNGNVSKIELIGPSSIEPLDLASSDAIREADLPRLPASFPYEQERIEGTFLLDVPEMRWFRDSLTALKMRGMF